MNFDRISQWIGILANVGVIGGFVLVAYQLQTNTESLRANSVYTSAALSSNSEMALTGENANVAWAKALTEPASVSTDELMQVWAIMALSAYSATQTYADYRAGLADEDRWLFARSVFIAHITHPIGLVWWDEVKPGLGAAQGGFIRSVDEALAQSPELLMSDQFQRVLQVIQRMGKQP